MSIDRGVNKTDRKPGNVMWPSKERLQAHSLGPVDTEPFWRALLR